MRFFLQFTLTMLFKSVHAYDSVHELYFNVAHVHDHV